jgi:hypothetical protein
MRMSAEELRDATCVVCPAQVLALGEFNVSDRPASNSRFDRELGYRVDTGTSIPVCVHPYRIGVPAGAYRSAGTPLPADSPEEPPAPTRDALELPTDATNLEAWIIAVIRAAGPSRLQQALAATETTAAERFDERDVVAAMRRVLTVELTRR